MGMDTARRALRYWGDDGCGLLVCDGVGLMARWPFVVVRCSCSRHFNDDVPPTRVLLMLLLALPSAFDEVFIW